MLDQPAPSTGGLRRVGDRKTFHVHQIGPLCERIPDGRVGDKCVAGSQNRIVTLSQNQAIHNLVAERPDRRTADVVIDHDTRHEQPAVTHVQRACSADIDDQRQLAGKKPCQRRRDCRCRTDLSDTGDHQLELLRNVRRFRLGCADHQNFLRTHARDDTGR